MEPALNTEIACHLRYAQTHGALIATQAFQAKCQLMPHFVGHNLRIGILHNVANLRGLVALRNLLKRHSLEKHLTGTLTMGRKNRLQVTQKRRFTATALAAKCKVASCLYLERNIIQRGRVAPRIMKRYILESELRHTKISLALINVGKNSNMQ